jgi:hypothetical protein
VCIIMCDHAGPFSGEGFPESLQVRRNLLIHCRHVHLNARASNAKQCRGTISVRSVTSILVCVGLLTIPLLWQWSAKLEGVFVSTPFLHPWWSMELCARTMLCGNDATYLSSTASWWMMHGLLAFSVCPPHYSNRCAKS